MEKNISINISGIIFHIEEDGYRKLKEYLESINTYFATYEDSNEIIADIENRIAEIFLSKLDDRKQIINQEDVSTLIATMGTVADFEAIEDEYDKATTQSAKENTSKETKQDQKKEDNAEPKKLLRDEKRKILGGVGAGIAHYFGIDSLWVRMIFIILLFLGPVGGAILIAYIVLWIVIPGSTELGDDTTVKKMYRDSEHSVMGGVASGIAAYFGADITVVRLLFIVSIFLGGLGLILYFILWIITPEAKTITEKMEMQGEPVTLSNIEQNIKNSLNIKEGEEENILVKILLFPFRVLGTVFKALGKLVGPFSKFIVEGLRIFAGLIITIIGVVCMISLFLFISVLFGIISNFGGLIHLNDLPIEMVKNSLPTIGFISIFIASVIPFFTLILLGISILLKKIVLNAAIGWSLFGIWILSMFGLGISVRSVYINFRNKGEYTETRTFEFKNGVPIFKLEYIDDINYDLTKLRIRGHEDSLYKLDLKYQSYGKTKKEAKDNAQLLNYDVTQLGNSLIFNSGFQFKEGTKFRYQKLDMTLYVPYGKEFLMDENLKEIIRNTIHRGGYRVWQMENNQWIITEEDGLECITCDKSYSKKKRNRKKKNINPDDVEGESMTFEIEDFDRIEMSGNFDVFIRQGSTYNIELKGIKRYLKRVYVKKYNDELIIDMENDKWESLRGMKRRNKIKIFITLPELSRLEGSGITDITIVEFDFDDLKLSLSGASSADINITSADDIELDLDGAVSVDLQGNAGYLDANLSIASKLKAYNLILESAKITTKDAASARVNVNETLEVYTSGVSRVRYKGNPDLIVNEDELSNVRKTD